jgi:hypothetical protein
MQSTGILKPQLQNRWTFKVVPSQNLDPDLDLGVFTSQAISCSIDYSSNYLYLTFEQNTSDDTLHRFFQAAPYTDFIITTIDGHNNETAKLFILGAMLLNHSFSLDYAASQAAAHSVTFSFDSIEVGEVDSVEVEEEELKLVDSEAVSAVSVPELSSVTIPKFDPEQNW